MSSSVYLSSVRLHLYLSLHPPPTMVCDRICFTYKWIGICLFVASYVMQLGEEEALDYPPPAQTAATEPVLPAMATTYNYRKAYAFTQPDSSSVQNDSMKV